MAKKLEEKELERARTDFDPPTAALNERNCDFYDVVGQESKKRSKEPVTAERLLDRHTPKSIRDAIEEITPTSQGYAIKLRDGWTAANGERELLAQNIREYAKLITRQNIKRASGAAAVEKKDERPIGEATVQKLAAAAVEAVEKEEAEQMKRPAKSNARRQLGRPSKRKEETKMLTARLPYSLWKKLRLIAFDRDQSCADVIIDLLERVEAPKVKL